MTSPIDESWPKDIEVSQVPEYLARKKAEALLSELQDKIIVSADTIVTVGSNILGKPRSQEEAQRMLQQLSGKIHIVYSGVCIVINNKFTSFVEATEVTFKKLTQKEIDHYILHYAPMDKAGAYGIQEWIGLIGIEKISGSYFNVVGLPVCKLYTTLQTLDLITF